MKRTDVAGKVDVHLDVLPKMLFYVALCVLAFYYAYEASDGLSKIPETARGESLKAFLQDIVHTLTEEYLRHPKEADIYSILLLKRLKYSQDA